MPDLETEEQVRAYLSQIYWGVPFDVHKFEGGWICKEGLPPHENMGRGLGAASLIIDSDTKIVTMQSSLPMNTVAERYSKAKRNGERLPGRQVYPYRWEITLERCGEDEHSVNYNLTVLTVRHPDRSPSTRALSIDKQTLRVTPSDQLTRRVRDHIEWASRREEGGWPLHGVTHL